MYSAEVIRCRGEMKRWSNNDKHFLLNLIKENPLMFEKPTAQVFYSRIISNYPETFQVYGWKGMRDKIRNLKQKYLKALDLKNNSVGDIDTNDSESTIKENMLKICEDFDVLDYIFGGKKNSITISVYDSASETTSEEVKGGKLESSEIIIQAPPNNSNKRRVINDTVCLSEVPKDKTVCLPKYLENESIEEKTLLLEKEKFRFFKDIEQRKLRLEEQKLALETRMYEEECKRKELENLRNYDLKKMRLENEMRLKELELKYKFNKE